MFFVLALVGVFPGQVIVTWGTRMSLASNAALLTLTLPVSTAIFAFIFLGERMTGIRWISFALAIAGVVLCSGIDFKSLSFRSKVIEPGMRISMTSYMHSLPMETCDLVQ